VEADFPEWLRHHLDVYLKHAAYPLAVRSSSLLEDAQFQPFAGIYKTYMIPNNHPDHHRRLEELILAIKLVYASTYSEASRAFAQSTSHRIEDEKMAVVIQRLTGSIHGDYYYPAISGVAQSYNFYPVAHLQPDDGIAHIALGLGKIVVEGGTTLRFSPRHPQHLPQLSTVDDILENSQRDFFALKMSTSPEELALKEDATLAKLDIAEVATHAPIKYLCSTYVSEDHRIRDGLQAPGYCVLTFANILKYRSFPLPEIVSELFKIGRTGMGCPVEMEFAVNLPLGGGHTPEFNLLQIRPMAVSQYHLEVEISEDEIGKAFCYSTMALGNGHTDDIKDIIYVNPHAFEPAHTMDIAAEVGRLNHALFKKNRKYLLIGPGRWGTADRWLGIPVKWKDISGVGAIIETAAQNLKADPSQGSHFFHNITSLGISYFTTSQNKKDFIDWEWLQSLPAAKQTTYLKHIKLAKPLTIKIDGKTSRGIIVA
jgi:hypothetical protein